MLNLNLNPQFEQALALMAADKGVSVDALAADALAEALEDWQDARNAEAILAASTGKRWTMEEIEQGLDLTAEDH